MIRKYSVCNYYAGECTWTVDYKVCGINISDIDFCEQKTFQNETNLRPIQESS